MRVVHHITLGRYFRLELIKVSATYPPRWSSGLAFVFMVLLDLALWLLKYAAIVVVALLLLQVCALGEAAAATIPKAAEQHRATLIRTARAVWGMDAPVAVFAAQIHTESRWNPEAKSPVGALGMAQFMPATAAWMPNIDPELAPPAPRNPAWAIRGLLRYNLYIWDRVDAVNDFERMAFTLSAYNGGLGWVNRDKKLAAQKGINPRRWFGCVETVNAGRSSASIRENRSYPRLILQERQYYYEKAGWGRGLREPERQ